MKTSKIVSILTTLIGVLSFVAAGVGVFWQGTGSHFEFKTVRDQIITLQGSGLYQFDSVSNAAQAIAQDVVTLVVGLPLLIISLMMYRKNLLRGKLLLCGTLAYFLYTYTSYAFGVAYNSLFLVYVALFSLSLVALILSLAAIEVKNLPLHFSSKLPRKSIATFLFLISAFLLLAWLGRIVPALPGNGVPVGLESSTSLFIQVLDLGLIVPLAFIAGLLLLKRNPLGYLLSTIVIFKAFTLGSAVSAMVVGQLLAGIEVGPVELIMFPAITLVGIVLTFVLLKNISERIINIEIPTIALSGETQVQVQDQKELVGRM
jgi:hypothetical protein